MSFGDISGSSGGYPSHNRGSMNDTIGTDGLTPIKTKLAQFQVSLHFLKEFLRAT